MHDPKRTTRRNGVSRPASAPPETFPPGAYDENGVDVTLVRWMLSLTPAERLEALEDWIASIESLRGE